MPYKKRQGNSDSVRSVERAIELLEMLNRSPLSTIGDLHRYTGIPKSSILRLLRTLEAKGLVTQTSSYSSYRLLEAVTSLSCGFLHEPLIIEVAEQAMTGFTEREGWPLALALFDTNVMVVRASTIPSASLYHVHSSLHMRLNLVDFALGRAFLAHCSPREQRVLLDFAGHGGGAAQPDRHIMDMLKDVRERGYAVRDPQFQPQSSTLAVPVFDRGKVIASLGLTWLSAALPVEEAMGLYATQLKAIAGEISRNLDIRSRTVRERIRPEEQDEPPLERFSVRTG